LAGSASPRSTNVANIGTSYGFFSIGYGSPRRCATCPSFSPAGTRYSPGPADLLSSAWIFSIPWPDWDAREMLAATTLAQIPLTRCGPLLSSTSLRALGRRRLHPPRAGGLHSHTLGGCAGGGWWRCAWTLSSSRGSRGDSGRNCDWIHSSGCY
jgi:hypothetical protein